MKLEKEKVLAEAKRQRLLQEADPTLREGLRVPLGEGGEIGYTADDWTEAWKFGWTEFCDEYALSHQRKFVDFSPRSKKVIEKVEVEPEPDESEAEEEPGEQELQVGKTFVTIDAEIESVPLELEEPEDGEEEIEVEEVE